MQRLTNEILNIGAIIESPGIDKERYMICEIRELKKIYIDREPEISKEFYVEKLFPKEIEKPEKTSIQETKSKITHIDDCEKEIWKSVKGFRNLYEVSNIGRVRKKTTKYVLSLYPNSSRNNVRVNLRKDGKLYNCSVHRLVAEAFLENPNNFKYVTRKDGNYLNNRVDNLKYVESLSDTHRAKEVLTNKLNNPGKFEGKRIINDKMQVFNSIEEAAEYFNICTSSISRALSGLQHTAGGHEWCYV